MTKAADLSALGSNVTTSGNLSSASTLSLQTNSTTAVTVDASQNVGIGTTSPANFLDVSKTQNAETNIGLSNTSTGADAQVRTKYTTNSGLFTIGTTGTAHPYGGDAYIYQVANKGIRFATNDTERMRIDSSGFVGIGTTANIAAGRLSISYLSATQRGLVIRTDTTSTTAQIRFENPNGGVGEILTSGSSTSYGTSSDYRLKENVASMTGALNTVAQLKPVTWKWKIDGSNGQGFIAHELQEVVPDCVTGEKDAVNEDGSIKAQGVDTSFLVATLTAAIQEQQTIINDLKADIAELKEKVGK